MSDRQAPQETTPEMDREKKEIEAALDRVMERAVQITRKTGKRPKKREIRKLVRAEPALHNPEAVRMLLDKYPEESKGMREKVLAYLFV